MLQVNYSPDPDIPNHLKIRFPFQACQVFKSEDIDIISALFNINPGIASLKDLGAMFKKKGKGMNLMGQHVKKVADNLQWKEEDDDDDSSFEDDYMTLEKPPMQFTFSTNKVGGWD